MGNNLVRKLTLGLLLIIFVVPILATPLTALAIDPPPAGGAPAQPATSYSFQSDHIQINYGTCGWDEFGCHLAKVFKIIVIGILTGLGGFFAGIFELFTQATLVMIRFGTIVMQLGVVREGAKATMSVANLLFVLALIVIAFATIFQASAYSAKALLKKLIIAAILVNFSFLIAGLLLDVANVFTNSFASKFDAATIASSIQPQRIAAALLGDTIGVNRADGSRVANDPTNKDGALVVQINNNDRSDDGWKIFLQLTAALLFSVLMTFLLMCVMISLALMTLARNIWIAILLILMPIVWALQFLPELSGKWKEWWSKFLQWTVYLPVVTFFIYVSTFAATGLDDKVLGIVTNTIGPSAAGYAALLTVTVQILIVCGLLISGLFAAKASGGFGAAAGLGLAAWASGKIKGAAKGATIGTARGVAGGATKLAGQSTRLLGQTALFKGKYNPLRFLGGGKLLRGAGGAVEEKASAKIAGKGWGGLVAKGIGAPTKILEEKMIGTSASGSKEIRKAATKYQKDYLADKSKDELIAIANKGVGGTANKLGLLQTLIDKNLIGDIKDDRAQELIANALKTKSSDAADSASRALSIARPDLAPTLKYGEKLEDFKKNPIKMNLLATKHRTTPDKLNDAQIKEEAIEEFLGGLNATDLAKVKISKLDPAMRARVSQMFTRSPGLITKFLAQASDAEGRALLSAVETNVADFGRQLNGILPGGGRNWETLHRDETITDGRLLIAQKLTSLRATGAAPDQIAQVESFSKNYEAWHRINQTPGFV